MCGIAGMMRLSAAAPPLPLAELGRIDAALARRGPDGHAAWQAPDGWAAFVHRRLAIIDLTTAAEQPMVSADGRRVLVFNGEIYNYRDLRHELEARGAVLRTHSDSEVLLELVALDGVSALPRLRGMFAFALWDSLQGTLLAARDPYGIKPLYYAVEGGVLRFASQVKALTAGGGLPAEIDPAAVAGFLSWGAVPEPLTLYRAIRALPAGHVLTASEARGVHVEPLPYSPPDELPGTTEQAIAESVEAHLVSDVPVALFLSAGIDSALVAALATKALPEPPVALTLTWKEIRGTARDEEPLARATAQALGMDHVVREVAGEEVREALPEILDAMDQPSIDGFNTWLIARVAREEGFKVALSGLGGDEVFGGYPSFRDVPLWHRQVRALARVPGGRAIASGLLPLRPGVSPKTRGVMRYGSSIAGSYFLRRGLFLPEEIAGLRAEHDGDLINLAGAFDPVLDTWQGLSEGILGPSDGLLGDPWRAVHRMESAIYLRRQLLRDADWAGMAHGVEIRVPLVDARLRLALETHGFEPARAGGKRSVAQSVAPELPAELHNRRKTGFQLPIADWLEHDRGLPRSVGEASRRLACLVLRAFGVDLSEARDVA